MSNQPPMWKIGKDKATGWEVLSIPDHGTFTRDTAERYYYLYGVGPTTWMQIADETEIAQLRQHFTHAFAQSLFV
jgi:hypothetical protein